MIIAYLDQNKLKPQEISSDNLFLLQKAIWIDLLSPPKEEELQIEKSLNLDIPTREEMREIEVSSRLYKEHGLLFMTASMIAHSESPEPTLDPVTFVLTKHQLITIRYIEPQAFRFVNSQLKNKDTTYQDATSLLIELLDASIDRLADTLELVGNRLDEFSKMIFRSSAHDGERLDYHLMMRQVGANGDLNTKARESLVSFSRLIAFFSQSTSAKLELEAQTRLVSLSKDIISLSDHANFISNKINFLLDATLGMVNIEQNNIIKIFSVAAVIFLPPTLVASIYGMNFHFMPELSWKYGYIVALSLIAVAAWLPYKYFKYKKWL